MKNTNRLAIVARMISQTTGVNWEIVRNKMDPFKQSLAYDRCQALDQHCSAVSKRKLFGKGLQGNRRKRLLGTCSTRFWGM